MAKAAHAANPLAAIVTREQSTEPVPSEPRGFMADLDTALRQRVFDIAQTQRETHTYIINTKQITSGDELKQRKGLCSFALDLRFISGRYQPPKYCATLV